MDGIIRRALVVVIIGCLAYGALMVADGSIRTAKAEATMTQEEAKRVQAAKACTSMPEGSDKRVCKINTSFASHDYYYAQKDRDAAFADRLRAWKLLCLGLVLWPAYMLLRWILTGHARPSGMGTKA